MKKLTATILLLFSIGCYAQHNSDYIQYMFNGLLINPAYAGSQEALNITGMYRKQWVGLTGAPTGAILTAHSPLKNKSLNAGMILTNEQFGIYDHTNAALAYAYRLRFLSGKLSLGLQGGVDTYNSNWNRIKTTEGGDPNFAPVASRQIIPIAGAGAYFYNKNFYLGLSVPNLPINHNDFTTILTSGCILKFNEVFRIKPAVLLKHIHGSPVSANLSATFYYKDVIGLGLGYTYQNSAMVYGDIKLNNQLNLGYGYAYMLNTLGAYTSGSHEIILRYLFRYKLNAVNARYF